MNLMAPTHPAELHVDADMMTRREVARLFGVTSAAVATWARRGRLPEVRNEAGRPRYRCADVEELLQSVSWRPATVIGYRAVFPARTGSARENKP
jgi:predicted site-specific integrase-resolvase